DFSSVPRRLDKIKKRSHPLTLHIAQKPATEAGEFKVIPKRWIVERTFAWLGNFRRLAKDFEILITTAENMIRIAMLKLTVAKCL
ncbi:MAG: transposase, partial [Candidatus Contendobacter sp.]|nr:transposase [Candidatus Contendobacter sp.]